MTPPNENSGAVGETAKVISEIMKAAPIYPDAIQPGAKEIGKSLQLLGRAINAALAPLEAFVWGVEQIREFVHDRVATKLENVPPEDVQRPKAHIAVPALEALRYLGEDPDLSELYANLLATSMDAATTYRAHPAFVEIIKNMSPDEARMMRFVADGNPQALINIKVTLKGGIAFSIACRHVSLIGVKAGCQHVGLAANYVDNLVRLGLVEIPEGRRLSSDDAYQEIEEHTTLKEILDELNVGETHSVELLREKMNLTDFGQQFVQSCVIDKAVQDRS